MDGLDAIKSALEAAQQGGGLIVDSGLSDPALANASAALEKAAYWLNGYVTLKEQIAKQTEELEAGKETPNAATWPKEEEAQELPATPEEEEAQELPPATPVEADAAPLPPFVLPPIDEGNT